VEQNAPACGAKRSTKTGGRWNFDATHLQRRNTLSHNAFYVCDIIATKNKKT
jgi:hypothetical protein